MAATVFLGVAAILIGALSWPLLFTDARAHGESRNHLWFMWNQSEVIRMNHLPSLFLNYTTRVFYPHFAFYGGTLYVIVGVLSLALGNAPVQTFVLMYLVGFATAHGGWYWLARIAGLGRSWAHVPGALFITSPYYLTLVYARGDWPEFLGVSMIPMVAGAAVAVLRAERLRLWPATALTASSVVFFGSHNITILWGSTLLALVAVALLVGVPATRSQVTRSGVIRVAGLVLPALLVSAWVLLPTLAYQSHTFISVEYKWEGALRRAMHLVTANHLFTTSRASASVDLGYVMSLPIVAMAWVLVGIVLLSRAGEARAWLRIALIAAAITAGLTILMTHATLILALPRPYSQLQFSYRLESYVLLGVSGAVLAVLALAVGRTSRGRLWTWMVVPVLAVSLVGAVQQVDANGHSKYPAPRLGTFLEPPSINEEYVDYVDAGSPFTGAANLPKIEFPPAAIRHDRTTLTVHLHPGELVSTNLEGGPHFVHVAGAKIVGVDPEGNSVLQIGQNEPVSTQRIALSPAAPLPVALGRVLSVLGLLALLVQLGRVAVVGLLARGAGARVLRDRHAAARR